MTLLFIALMTMTASLNAQHHKPHHRGGKMDMEQLKTDLNLTDAQVAEIQKGNETLRAEMMELKNSDISKEEKHAQFKALRDKKKAIMDGVLTDEQKVKMDKIHQDRMEKREGMKEERMAEHKKRMEAHKPMIDEMKAYHNANIKPVINKQRAELDKKMKRKDRKEVNRLRAIAKEALLEMEAEFEKGGMAAPPHHKGMRGHGPKGGHMGMGGKKDMMKLMHLWQNHQEDLEKAIEYSEKYGTEIDKLIGELDQNEKEWKSDLMEIKKKYISDEEMAEWHKKKSGKSGCNKENKSSCTRGEKSECKKGEKSACKKGGEEKRAAHHEMMEKMKRVGFLLMPTDLFEEEMKAKVKPLMVLDSKVFPNPSGSSNTLEFNVVESGRYMVELFNKEGKRIKQVANEKLDVGIRRYEVDLGELPAGSYYYIITDGKSKTSQQFIKN